jgi:hypothetical protein
MMLTILHNKKNLNSFVESLTVRLLEAADRYDRIDILTSELPDYLSLITGKPAQSFTRWVEKNPKKIEKIETIMHDDPNYLRDVMENLDKFFPVIK